jgi:hypothetical protein
VAAYLRKPLSALYIPELVSKALFRSKCETSRIYLRQSFAEMFLQQAKNALSLLVRLIDDLHLVRDSYLPHSRLLKISEVSKSSCFEVLKLDSLRWNATALETCA